MRSTGPGSVVLGFSCDYHDAAAALVVDGEIVAAAEEERFSRVKHDRSLPREAVRACLAESGLDAHDIGHVVFYEKPLMVVDRYLAARRREGPGGIPAFVRDGPTLLRRNLLVGYRMRSFLRELGVRRPPLVRYIEHHASHAAAAFHPSGFDQAAIITVDGLGEWATATIGHGTRRGIELLEEQRYPHSLGLVYSLVTAWCGFEPNDGEYKLMGLAPYGTPRFGDALSDFVSVGDDGRIEVDVAAVRCFSGRALRSRRLERALGGPPRDPGAPIGERETALAASVQALTERAMLAMADHAHRLTGERQLCLAGGAALNCVANGRILREGPFEELWIQPAAGDAGSAVGAALEYWHGVLGEPRSERTTDGMGSSLLGPSLAVDVAVDRLEELGVAHTVLDEDAMAAAVAARIADGAIVGVCAGRMEFGPRALGNRSILADPRDPTVRDRLNLRVKGRESFRPFAPAVLADRVHEWFDLDQPSPYMLIVAPVRADRRVAVEVEPDGLSERGAIARSVIPACTHVDGSARIQTVDPASNPGMHRFLTAFDRLTGCPVLVNTSFNLAGEPIVADADDALRTAKRADLDLLVLGHALVERAALEGLTLDALDPHPLAVLEGA